MITELRVPGDKSISHRALLLAALAGGESRIRGILTGEDPQATASILRALGVRVPPLVADAELRITGVGVRGLRAPGRILDCANSGTTARLMLGVLAGQELEATLTGDESLRRRPMRRVTDPLSRMGARFEPLAAPGRLPLRIAGGPLHALDYRLPVASAQLKSALLLAGVTGGVPVRLLEPGFSRDHTERMLAAVGCALTSSPERDANRVRLTAAPAALDPLDVVVPGDFSSAAFPLALALLGGAGEGIVLRGIGLNPTRTGLLPVLQRMNARIEVEIGSAPEGGEPAGDLIVHASDLTGTHVERQEIPGLIDEVPVLAVLAARARGVTRITGAEELRVKESDRLGALAANLSNLGVEVEELPDGLVIEGAGRPLTGAVEARGDHRIAMAFGVLGALAGNAITVDAPAAVGVSYPGFWEMLERASRPAGRPSVGDSGEDDLESARPVRERGRGPVIVIDGPAGSGKSTTAREVARRLGFRHLDSGALYRALTCALLESGRPPESWPALTESDLNAHPVRMVAAGSAFRMMLGARALTTELRSPEVDAHVSAVARLPAVRGWLLDRQRQAGREGSLVGDGRDLGTVVFPDAEVKIFLVADVTERARRRLLEKGRVPDSGSAVTAEAARLRARDRIDTSRGIAPLKKAADAFEVDGTRLSFDQQVDAILGVVRGRVGHRHARIPTSAE
ncbi:MAG: 3-phosphoshikimate 1-carboxyvinyltransferase [Gammaproteobacteria bacterium]|nr:3-phosphoshikimate 1-carboxyvinyltransferase [Gammaproteobacteria bacterium]